MEWLPSSFLMFCLLSLIFWCVILFFGCRVKFCKGQTCNKTKMVTFLDFPIHILLHIRDYVFLPDIHLIHEQCDGEKYEDPGLELTRSRLPDWIEICTPKDWRSFVNTNKTDFLEIKKKTVYYDVNKFLCSKLIQLVSSLSRNWREEWGIFST